MLPNPDIMRNRSPQPVWYQGSDTPNDLQNILVNNQMIFSCNHSIVLSEVTYKEFPLFAISFLHSVLAVERFSLPFPLPFFFQLQH